MSAKTSAGVMLAATMSVGALTGCGEREPSASVQPPAPPPSVEERLQARMAAGPLTAQEQRALTRVIADALPGTRVRAWSFYADGDPMMCGETDSVRVGLERRFLVKNGYAVVEGDISRSVFEEFWQICTAGAGLAE